MSFQGVNVKKNKSRQREGQIVNQGLAEVHAYKAACWLMLRKIRFV